MTLSIQDPEADALARRLAAMDQTSVSDAVLVALREAIDARTHRETPSQAARRILAKHGLVVRSGRTPAPAEAYSDLDHDLTSAA